MEPETQTTPQGGRKGLTSTMPTKPEREEAPKHNEHGSRRRRHHGACTTNGAEEEDRGAGAQEEEGVVEEEESESQREKWLGAQNFLKKGQEYFCLLPLSAECTYITQFCIICPTDLILTRLSNLI